MRVVLLITDLERGGTPLRIARLARGLRALGIDAVVGCLAPPGPISTELDADGIPTFACGARSARDLGALLRLALHIRRIKPDLIHSTLTHANVAARVVGKLQGIPVLTSTATIEMERRWHRTVERLTARMDEGHVVNSPGLAEHVQVAFGIPKRRVFVVAPSVRRFPKPDRAVARAALQLPEDAFVAVWAGRFDPVKRLDLLLDAARQLRGLHVRFVLAGDGPERERIGAEIRAAVLESTVSLPGWMSDLGTLLAAGDVFVFPSLTEGMPNALLEALAAGLPALATENPTARALAEQYAGLRLVGHDGSAIARALAELQSNAEDRATWRAAAAAGAGQIDDEYAAARTTADVYQRVLEQVSGKEKSAR